MEKDNVTYYQALVKVRGERDFTADRVEEFEKNKFQDNICELYIYTHKKCVY